jgi:predicted HicB family RNase H-like nuclease
MHCKGYTAHAEIDPEDGVLHGWVDNIEDVVTFEADNLEDLEREFRISVDDYLEWCAEDGVEPNRPSTQPKPAS